VTVDSSDTAYVADYVCIRRVSAAGVVVTIAGSRTSGYADGIGRAASFWSLAGIVLDEAVGMLYVTDQHRACSA
jgi:hypothetical protein